MPTSSSLPLCHFCYLRNRHPRRFGKGGRRRRFDQESDSPTNRSTKGHAIPLHCEWGTHKTTGGRISLLVSFFVSRRVTFEWGSRKGRGEREGGREWENQKFLLHEGFRDRIEEGEPYLVRRRKERWKRGMDLSCPLPPPLGAIRKRQRRRRRRDKSLILAERGGGCQLAYPFRCYHPPFSHTLKTPIRA